MQVAFHKYFVKRYRALPTKTQDRFDSRLAVFCDDPHDARLNNHGLHGKYAGYRSINVTGDIRAIFKVLEEGERAVFVDIGTHGELYT